MTLTKIKNAAFNQILGTNTKIERKLVGAMIKNESIELEWIIPNIFNDGLYYIDTAVVYKGGHTIADWWEDAASFKVYKETKTPYLVSPEISVITRSI